VKKRIGLGVAAVLLLAAGFGAGWLIRGEVGRAARWQSGKEDEAEFWRYPKADPKGSALEGGSPHLAVLTTPDDIATVAAWYAERLESGSIPGDMRFPPPGPAPVAIPVGSPDMRAGFGTEVSYAAGGDSLRGAKVGFCARTSPASAITVFLSRADGEDRTHIVISFSRR
jgi:hypothetical protein